MTARTHDLAAITAWGVVLLSQPARSLSLATVLASVLANQIGGIAPDIDQPTAPLWRNLPIGRFFGRAVDRLLGGHRFLTHSLLGLALFGLALHWTLGFLQPIMPTIDAGVVWWAFMIGMVSHLVMDSFTKEGVPWLLPLPFKFGFPPLKALRITTGKKAEVALFVCLLAFDVYYCAVHYGMILDILHHHID